MTRDEKPTMQQLSRQLTAAMVIVAHWLDGETPEDAIERLEGGPMMGSWARGDLIMALQELPEVPELADAADGLIEEEG